MRTFTNVMSTAVMGMAAGLALSLAAPALSFAEGDAAAPAKKCACSKKCMKDCKAGKGAKKCKCEACDCSKTGKCAEGSACTAEGHDDKHDAAKSEDKH